jgi:3-oxoacyl-(acyl-carrier-protein) synthase/acyl carrier protein
MWALQDVVKNVVSMVSQCVGIEEPSVELEAPLLSMGLNSLSAVELRNDLARHFNLTLPSTLVFDYPTVDSMSKYILPALNASSTSTLSDASMVNTLTTQQRHTDTVAPISIDRIAHRLAAPAPEPLSITTPLIDTCRTVLLERWDADLSAPHIPNRPGSRFSRFLDNIQLFDTQAFSVARSEAIFIDPQHRMMLEGAYEVLPLPSEHEAQVGVLAALSFWDYSIQADRHLAGAGEAYKATGRCFSVASGRISFCYGLKGPSISVDTACSSYLSAVHLGRQMINEGRCKVGLVTAALLTLDPATIGMLTAASMLAPDGRCKTLDAKADGYVRGEACITISMSHFVGQTTSLALIAGSAVNQDGRSSSLTAPNGPSQQEVLSLAQYNAALSPAEISAVEMHGTGTALGDPIEVGAIAAVFGSVSESRANYLEFSTAKSHMGHAEPAAGGVGLQRALASINSLATLGTLHLSEVNPYVVGALEQCKTPLAWMPRTPSAQHAVKTIGISGFAFQGSNAHLMVGGQISSETGLAFAAKTVHWRRTAQWFIPSSRAFSVRAKFGSTPSAGVVMVECDVQHPGLAFLWQHQINGRSILPGTAMFEAIHASTVSLLGHTEASLIGTALHAPLLLPKTSTVLSAKVDRNQGNVELGSVSKSGKQLHATTQRIAPEQTKVVEGRSASKKRKVNRALIGKIATASAAAAAENKASVCHLDAAGSTLVLDNYSIHPALADASTHLGALYDTEQGSRPRVPVLLRCLRAAEKAKKTLSTASMTDVAVLPNGDRSSIFNIKDAASLHGLQSRPLTGASNTASLSATSNERALIYSTKDEASECRNSNKEQANTNIFSYEGMQCAWKNTTHALNSFAVGCSLLQDTLKIKTSARGSANATSTHSSLHGLYAVAASEAAPLYTINFDTGNSTAGVYFTPTLKLATENSAAQWSRSTHSSSTLISGGLSGIGLLTAAWMASQQGEPLVLIGRTGRVANENSFAASVMNTTASVHMAMCDIAASEGLQNLALNSPLGTVIHAAGVLCDGILANQNVSGAFKVFAPKLDGTRLLLKLAHNHPLAACQLFSSISAPLGNPGQANYAAANSALESIAQDFYKAGVPAQSVGWGPWAQSGMAATDAGGSNLLARLERSGMGALQPHAGLSIIRKLLHRPDASTWMAGIFNWEKLLQGQRRKQALFANSELLLEARSASTKADQPAAKEHPQDNSIVAVQKEGTADLVSALVASVIGESIEVNAPLMDSGLDSLGAVELRNSLAASFALPLPATVVFDYPTIEALSKYISNKTSKTSHTLTHQKQQQAAAGSETRADMKQRVLSIVSVVLGSDEIQEDQPFMEVSTEAR